LSPQRINISEIMTSPLQTKDEHPSTKFPDTKEELLSVLREKWTVDPIKQAAILMGQTTPRYFRSKSDRQDVVQAFADHVEGLDDNEYV
jgi:hypothetical protein